jgi:hypothetical protein
MFSRIRKRVTYANVAVTLALFFAIGGGAYAAGRYVITSTKQIKPSVLKALQGKAGPAGPTGAGGAAGAQGPAGAQGAAGAKGETGAKGEAGAEGNEGPQGKQGKEGPPGPEGVCATSHCVLPPETTETGAWSFSQPQGDFETAMVPLSFNIPLSKSLEESDVYYVGKEAWQNHTAPAACPGSPEKPEATPGNLCVYEEDGGEITEVKIGDPGANTFGIPAPGAGRSGAVLTVLLSGTGYGFGAWAVTAAAA